MRRTLADLPHEALVAFALLAAFAPNLDPPESPLTGAMFARAPVSTSAPPFSTRVCFDTQLSTTGLSRKSCEC